MEIHAILAVAALAGGDQLVTCDVQGLSDLRARGVSCTAAKRVYDASLVKARRSPGHVTFRHSGRRWTCRAHHPQHRNGSPAWYEWKCRASGRRLVWYRFFSRRGPTAYTTGLARTAPSRTERSRTGA
jgi:hypothetical protein